MSISKKRISGISLKNICIYKNLINISAGVSSALVLYSECVKDGTVCLVFY